MKTVMIADLSKLLQEASAKGGTISGIGLPPRAKWPVKRVERVRFEDCDFSALLFSAPLLGRTTLDGCSFQKVILDGVNARKVDFVGCSFESVVLGKKLIGLFEECSFASCSFNESTLSGVSFVRTRFSDCTLSNVRAVKALWESCTFERFKLSGSLKSNNFRLGSYRDADFSGASLVDCSFFETREGEPKLPENPESFSVPSKVFLQAGDLLRGRLTPSGQEHYEAMARILSRSGEKERVDEGLFDELVAKDRALVMKTLYDLSR